MEKQATQELIWIIYCNIGFRRLGDRVITVTPLFMRTLEFKFDPAIHATLWHHGPGDYSKLAMASSGSLRMLLLRLIIILIVSLLSACGTSASPEKSIRQITEADAGRPVELHVGDTLEITLPANPTTGFQWEVSELDSAILRPVGEQTFEPSSNAVGSGGQVTLRFEAVGVGQTELKLILHRLFEKDVPPTQTFQATVLVE